MMKKSGTKAIFFLLSTLTFGVGAGLLYWAWQQGRLVLTAEDAFLMGLVSMIPLAIVCVIVAIMTDHHTWQFAAGAFIVCWALGSFDDGHGLIRTFLGENTDLIRTLLVFALPLVLTYLGCLFCIFKEKEYEYTAPPSYSSPRTYNSDDADWNGMPSDMPHIDLSDM